MAIRLAIGEKNLGEDLQISLTWLTLSHSLCLHIWTYNIYLVHMRCGLAFINWIDRLNETQISLRLKESFWENAYLLGQSFRRVSYIIRLRAKLRIWPIKLNNSRSSPPVTTPNKFCRCILSTFIWITSFGNNPLWLCPKNNRTVSDSYNYHCEWDSALSLCLSTGLWVDSWNFTTLLSLVNLG